MLNIAKKTAVVVCITAPFPVNSGTRLRSYSVIRWLRSNDYNVTAIYPGSDELSEGEVAYRIDIASAIALPSGNRMERGIRRVWNQMAKTFWGRSRESYSRIHIGFRAKKLLKKVSNQNFDIAVTEYAIATSITSYINAGIYILDTCDLMSIHNDKVSHAQSLFNDYRDKLSRVFVDLRASRRDFPTISDLEKNDLKRYDAVIAISKLEYNVIKDLDLRNRLYLIPPCVKSEVSKDDYSGFPIFAFSPNIFNTQGILHFVDILLPDILKKVPNFKLYITGDVPAELRQRPELICLGFVTDIREAYQRASYAIIPVFDGTGQQLKVVEAMSFGLAVVGYRKRVDPSILTHQIHGYLADSETDFVNAVINLWNNADLRKIMGHDSQNHVVQSLSQAKFEAEMNQLCQEVVCELAEKS